jgi:ferric-dicitrate binding protein FerR (iron transport regulator)
MRESHEIDANARRWVHDVAHDLSPSDWLDFKTWFMSDSRHRVAFLRAHFQKTLDTRLDALRNSANPKEFDASKWSIDGFGEARRKRIDTIGPRSVPCGVRQGYQRVPAVLLKVALVLLLCVGGMSGIRSDSLLSNPLAKKWDSYGTAVGSQKTVRLSGGESINLNTDTLLRTRRVGADSEVVLERGEAFFEIPHDASRPFKVIVDRLEIYDLGTSFDVYRRSDGHILIVVAEGGVRITRPPGVNEHVAISSLALTAGQAADIGHEVITSRLDVSALTCRLSWRTGYLCFDGEDLVTIFHEINRYNVTQIVIADPEVSDLRFVGHIQTDPEVILAALESLCAIRRMPSVSGDHNHLRVVMSPHLNSNCQ